MNGRTIAPKGISVSSDNQGEKPAFLQINQNGRTPTKPTRIPIRRIRRISGPPRGPKKAS
jgi:hypothetical protein